MIQAAAARHCSRRPSPRSRSRCTTTCPPGSSACARCGRATSSTRSTTCPRAQSPDVLRYWFPAGRQGHGRQRPDGRASAGGKNPVLAHLSSTTCSTPRTRSTNFGFIGYQPPQTPLDAATAGRRRLRAREPRDRGRQAGVTSTSGYRLLELPPAPTPRGTRSGSSSRPAADDDGGRPPPATRTPEARSWPAAGPARASSGSPLLFLAPLYVVLAIVFGEVDPIFRTPVPVWNPLHWDSAQFTYVLDHIVGPRRLLRPGAAAHGRLRRASASVLCLLIAYPVAYYTARLAGRWKGLLLAAADRAVLDQLHDADAGLGQPAADRRPGQPGAQRSAGCSTCTSTGCTGAARSW